MKIVLLLFYCLFYCLFNCKDTTFPDISHHISPFLTFIQVRRRMTNSLLPVFSTTVLGFNALQPLKRRILEGIFIPSCNFFLLFCFYFKNYLYLCAVFPKEDTKTYLLKFSHRISTSKEKLSSNTKYTLKRALSAGFVHSILGVVLNLV